MSFFRGSTSEHDGVFSFRFGECVRMELVETRGAAWGKARLFFILFVVIILAFFYVKSRRLSTLLCWSSGVRPSHRLATIDVFFIGFIMYAGLPLILLTASFFKKSRQRRK